MVTLLCAFTACGGGIKSRSNPNQAPGSASGAASKQGALLSSSPVVNIYLENSGSMNGYVADGGPTIFQQNIYNFLVDMRNSGYPSSVQCHYINNEVVPRGDDIHSFIMDLKPSSFKSTAGNKTETDMADLFHQVLTKTSDDTVSVFISDCIFSPGKVPNPSAYLLNQQIDIKDGVQQYLASHEHLGIMVYQCSSEFDGKYYDYKNNPHRYNGSRPYYIWVIGHPERLFHLRICVPQEGFLSEVENFWFAGNVEVDSRYTILPSPKKGEFSFTLPKEMSRIKPDKDSGEFMFTVGVDFRKLQTLLGEDYILEASNYCKMVDINEALHECTLMVIEKDNSGNNLTHELQISTSSPISKGDFHLALLCQVPQWAYNMTDNNDSVLNLSNEGKTYGLSYIFDGIQQAFSTPNPTCYSIIDLTIK